MQMCASVCTWEGSCFPKVLGLVVQEPCITFISLIHAWKDATSPTGPSWCCSEIRPVPGKQGKVTPAEACLGNMKISHLKLQSHEHSSFPSKKRNHYRKCNYMSDYKIRPNVGMRATHRLHCVLCEWEMTAGGYMREYLLFWRVLPSQ